MVRMESMSDAIKIGSTSGKWKVSVRLDQEQASLLRTLSRESSCEPSKVIRDALDQMAASRTARNLGDGAPSAADVVSNPASNGTGCPTPAKDGPGEQTLLDVSLPYSAKIADLLHQY